VVLVDDWFETGAQALAARTLIQETGATLVGMSIVVDDLNDEVRARLGRLHSLLRASSL
jgi:adenine phosphoribosyltransferase